MRHTDNSILPFQSETYGVHMHDDAMKPGRTPSRWHWWWIRVLYSDYTTAGTSQALDIDALATSLAAAGSNRVSGPMPTDCIMGYWAYDLRRVFAGGTVATATVIAGISGTTNGHLTSTNIFTGATLGRKQTGAASLFQPIPITSAPLLQIDTTGGNVNTFTQGCIDVYAQFCRNPFNQYLP